MGDSSAIVTATFDETSAESCPGGREADSSEDSDVCYGLICDIKVEPRWVPPNYADKGFLEVPEEGQSFLALRFSFREDVCIIQTQEEEDVAMLNRKSFDAFHDLPEPVRLEGLVHKVEWADNIAAVEKDSKSVRMTIDANIYGPRAVAETVARKLATFGLFLQIPYLNACNFPYENPQYLDLSHVVFFDIPTPPESSGFQEMTMAGKGSLSEITETVMDLNQIIEDVPQQHYLIEAPTDHDSRIMSSLLPHQKTAVDFIRRRETGDIPLGESLWEDLGSEPSCYKHRITGFNSETAQDALGGILADEMGLGKSLTLLARIVTSLCHANEFVGPDGIGLPPDSEGIVSAKSTLLVVPSAREFPSIIFLIFIATNSIFRHISPGTLKVHKYHGQHRQIDRPSLVDHDVVLTTYGTVATELRRGRGMLQSINWYRLVLDEAHVIRNWSTKQFKAVITIPAHIRWCLSGTPIQNSLEDLGALVKFLQVPVLKDGNNFNTYITRKTTLTASASRSDFENLRCLLGSVCLRRNKSVLPSYLNQFKEYTHPIEFSEGEKAQYMRLKKRCKRAIDMAVSGHKVKETHQSVLEALLRLRLFCNNGDVPSTGFSPAAPEEALSQMQQSGEAVCGYCSCEVVSLGGCDVSSSAVLTNCRKLVCSECVSRYQSDVQDHRNEHLECQLCRKYHEHDEEMFESIGENEVEDNGEKSYPTKLKVLLEDINQHKSHEKSVIFSFWKRTLDIVGKLFTANGVNFLRVDGSLPFAARKMVLSEFQTSTEKTVLLMTLGTGAVGLNSLAVASRLHILEPQWNPSVESQAMGRVLRLGQEKSVTIVRYIVNKTVEESVQQRQHRKVMLSSGGFKEDSKQKALLQTYSAMIS
ncbi:hypothetical protein GTA08_BOTSDO07089 [Botryosphaeria dothidea]|uniref:Dna repair protein rad5 protein n=1 Tax=Botryosphaeria dothidea TaxID=55169 RepID=A0A8H4MX91_9PEZI|nr:hypothetical protein GTA08_BOTSDO11284 [Botryosphaeria dothidea]KAF4305798.1 hypothetical protein GTA08_BOTSDO07089 [Botryosphaeria dothidea]